MVKKTELSITAIICLLAGFLTFCGLADLYAFHFNIDSLQIIADHSGKSYEDWKFSFYLQSILAIAICLLFIIVSYRSVFKTSSRAIILLRRGLAIGIVLWISNNLYIVFT